jgi:hypothetical protein
MAKSKNVVAGPSFLPIGSKLRYGMGDANVVDDYLFALAFGKELLVHFEGALRAGDLRFAARAVESATSHLVLSQGRAVSSGSPPRTLPDLITADLPPFS